MECGICELYGIACLSWCSEKCALWLCVCVQENLAGLLRSTFKPFIGASLSEPHIDEFAVNFLSIYISYVVP